MFTSKKYIYFEQKYLFRKNSLHKNLQTIYFRVHIAQFLRITR